MRWIVGPVCVLVLSACSILDRSELSDFTPTSPSSFVYRASTNYFYTPGARSDAEQTRLAWLDQYLRLNDMCESGYIIVRRDVRVRMTSALGNPIDDIVYHGHCQVAARN
jgi:hypothetical protein